MAVTGLVPARFLCLTAHLVITIAILWERDENVRACLPLQFGADQYEEKDTQLLVALCLSIGCFCVEYFGFFSGITTFLPTSALISSCLHSAACVALAFFIWDVWDCDFYWYIFAFCCAIPGFIELIVLIGYFGLRKVF